MGKKFQHLAQAQHEAHLSQKGSQLSNFEEDFKTDRENASMSPVPGQQKNAQRTQVRGGKQFELKDKVQATLENHRAFDETAGAQSQT